MLSNGNHSGSTAVLFVEIVETAPRYPVVVVVALALENNETRARNGRTFEEKVHLYTHLALPLFTTSG